VKFLLPILAWEKFVLNEPGIYAIVHQAQIQISYNDLVSRDMV
jgi:hypothetical protein